ncbi:MULTISPECIES: hypothetical protein [Sphingopyxis]|uniref:hypothetical protein n=1 Tax=Sphingopyxis TaxID=165697 RepID=UPI000836853A|nr:MULTISPECIES: hypothetical protein [Sphingopyxis]AVA14813.1 hypothetical protein C3E99_13965 [Sphingopyxis sp. MG]
MTRKLSMGLAGLIFVAAPTTALAASYGFNLFARVAVQCTVNHQPTGFGAIQGDAVSLGMFREYCNAPGGYELVVTYAPGTLVGTRLIAGNDEILLNGSGQAVLSRAQGPRVQERPIAAVPGGNGFDSDHLDLQIIPS